MFETPFDGMIERFRKGVKLAERRRVCFLGNVMTFKVIGETNIYYPTFDPITGGWKCTCPDNEHRSVTCKHIVAAMIQKDAEGL